jgi:hypothetical protein
MGTGKMIEVLSSSPSGTGTLGFREGTGSFLSIFEV